MTRYRTALFTAALCLPFGVTAVHAAGSSPDPLNRPAPGAKVMPDLSNTGQGLGMALLGARVNSDGTLLNGVGTTSSSLVGGQAGIYEVVFNRDVSSCIYSLTTYFVGYFYEAQPRAGNPNGIFIHIDNSSGTNESAQFYLSVICNK